MPAEVKRPVDDRRQLRNDRGKPPRRECLLDWAVKLFGVAAAVLFGIWAPLSYGSDNVFQEQQTARLKELIHAIEALEQRMEYEGALRAYEICENAERSVSSTH